MTYSLNQIRCQELGDAVQPLSLEDQEQYLSQLHTDWRVDPERGVLMREFRFPNFATTLAFVNQVGAVAESEGHHPNLSFTWGYLEVSLQTHSIEAISILDFVVATKIDTL